MAKYYSDSFPSSKPYLRIDRIFVFNIILLFIQKENDTYLLLLLISYLTNIRFKINNFYNINFFNVSLIQKKLKNTNCKLRNFQDGRFRDFKKC